MIALRFRLFSGQTGHLMPHQGTLQKTNTATTYHKTHYCSRSCYVHKYDSMTLMKKHHHTTTDLTTQYPPNHPSDPGTTWPSRHPSSGTHRPDIALLTKNLQHNYQSHHGPPTRAPWNAFFKRIGPNLTTSGQRCGKTEHKPAIESKLQAGNLNPCH